MSGETTLTIVAERIRQRCQPTPGGCLIFTGAHNEHGYGVVRVKDRTTKAHRVTLAAATNMHELPPRSVVAMHTCDNPPCCNPEHLRWGTPADNVADMHAKGRRVYPPRKPPTQGPRRKPAGRYTHATECVHGHPFTPENTRMKPNRNVPSGYERVCKTCARRRSTETNDRRRLARQARKEQTA